MLKILWVWKNRLLEKFFLNVLFPASSCPRLLHLSLLSYPTDDIVHYAIKDIESVMLSVQEFIKIVLQRLSDNQIKGNTTLLLSKFDKTAIRKDDFFNNKYNFWETPWCQDQ